VLKVRFVNLSEIAPTGGDIVPRDPDVAGAEKTLEELVQEWVDCACKVWWQKGGPKIDPMSEIVPFNSFAAADAEFDAWDSDITSGRETQVPIKFDAYLDTVLPAGDISDYKSEAIEIYLADSVESSEGVTHNCGSSSAYVILDIHKAQYNKYLLAHELGHVLGLTHPPGLGDACPGFPDGSFCSVMVPEKPNSSRNTLDNLTLTVMPWGAAFDTLIDQECGYEPDFGDLFHIVRDFPYDCGTEPSVPDEPFDDWWTHPDVWNSSSGTANIKVDHSPEHSSPSYTGPNYMHVRLHAAQPLVSTPAPDDEVLVYLYLAAPGMPDDQLYPLNGVIGPHLTFDRQPPPNDLWPGPSAPKKQSVAWSVPTTPSGPFPAQCCVFAVAVSTHDTAPKALPSGTPLLSDIVASPTSYEFIDLFRHLKHNNDVVQRNLHIQDVASPTSGSGLTSLPWVQMRNITRLPIPANIEIRTPSAQHLQQLRLEVDGKPLPAWPTIGITQPSRIRLADSLLPGKRMILRLQATLPPGLAVGTTIPIDVRFFLGDRLFTGYRHVLRIVRPVRAAAQVMDKLYGALRSVRPTPLSLDGYQLYKGVRQLTVKPEEWSSRWKGLAKQIDTLAQGQEMGRGIFFEGPELSKNLRHLAQVGLVEPKSFNHPLERIRDLADRIQEQVWHRAGRLPLS
jgi:hypothetical protein